jgi:tRNA G37 N-methylase Trm5
MMRWDILNELIQRNGYSSYLEIGVQDPNSCFNKINCKDKVSVDPEPRGECSFIGTSDQFFFQNNKKFDLIFIDGLHYSEQVVKDVLNSLKFLNEGGTIMCHDTLPTTEKMQWRYNHGEEWTGDVWKAIVALRTMNLNIVVKTINTDYGCTLIQEGKAEPLYVYAPEWEDFLRNKEQWMNITNTL